MAKRKPLGDRATRYARHNAYAQDSAEARHAAYLAWLAGYQAGRLDEQEKLRRASQIKKPK